jgi:hypothetical protein
MDEEEWGDEIEVNEDGSSARVRTGFKINDVSYRLFLETDEQGRQFFVYMYTPFEVAPKKMPEMSRLLNMINSRFTAGRVACHDDEESNPVQFMWKIPVAKDGFEKRQIGIMLSAAVQLYEQWGHFIAQCNFTNRPAKEIWEEYEASRKNEDADSNETPSEL